MNLAKENKESYKSFGAWGRPCLFTVKSLMALIWFACVLLAADTTTDDILKMIAAKLPDEVILLQVRRAGIPINLSSDELIKIKQAGASDQFVRALLQVPIPPVPASSGTMTDATVSTDPEISDVPYAIDSVSGRFLDLEKQRINISGGAKYMGFGGGSMGKHFEGAKSTVRFSRGTTIRFIVRANAPTGIDINSMVEMIKLTSKKDHREVVEAKVRPFGQSKSTQGANDVAIKVVRCGTASLCFASSSSLALGEYFIQPHSATLGISQGFLFGID